MILHLTDDQKFINGAYDMFEEYYEGLNHFFVQVSRNNPNPRYVQKKERLFFKALTVKANINFIINYARKHKIRYVLVHYLSPIKAVIANKLKQELGTKTYWIFYGADLYGRLALEGKYILNDTPLEVINSKYDFKVFFNQLYFFYLNKKSSTGAINQFIKDLNYFCFWNYYDFQLLKKHYITNAVYKNFLYFNIIDREIEKKKSIKKDNILVNHSASGNGNHKTVLTKIANLNGIQTINNIITPLSYGSEKIKLEVINIGEELFGNKFKPLINFLPAKDYYRLLDSISIAIFGNRRQEAGGNVFYLLSKGVKIFLRNDNNMIKWLRDQGFIVFSFEDNLNSIADLSPLLKDAAINNYEVYMKTFSKKRENKIIVNLIDY